MDTTGHINGWLKKERAHSNEQNQCLFGGYVFSTIILSRHLDRNPHQENTPMYPLGHGLYGWLKHNEEQKADDLP